MPGLPVAATRSLARGPALRSARNRPQRARSPRSPPA